MRVFSRSTSSPQRDRRRVVPTLAVAGAAVLVSGLLSVPIAAQGATSSDSGAHSALANAGIGEVDTARLGLPDSGTYTFLIELKTDSTSEVFDASKRVGTAKSAATAAKAQVTKVESAQKKLISVLPKKSNVVYTTKTLLAGVAVRTNVKNFDTLRGLANVAAVYPVAPKTRSNSYAVPLQKAPEAWEATSNAGEGQTIAIIDTGIDYTHANFGGPGTEAAYDTANAAEALPANPSLFPNDKVVGGTDLVGNAYNADPASASYSPIPHPDTNPLDCQGHGSHVAGIAAGFGENADGSTYTGAYDTSTPFSTLKIGPGMAPEASLFAIRVFGCDGSTDVVTAALEIAADPNGDGDPSDHVDVANMSLGSDFGSSQDADSIAADLAVAAGVTLSVSAGNSGDVTDVSGSPGNAKSVITVANTQDASNTLDSIDFTVDGTPHAAMGASRSAAFDWETGDLTGPVTLASTGYETGCVDAPGTPYTGKIVVEEWSATAASCGGSVLRSGNARNDGAIGFIFVYSSESLDISITGDTIIPGVIVPKSTGDAIKAAIAAGDPVVVTGTSAADFTQIIPGDNDKVAESTSRGIHEAGNLKPDVAAVGTSVFSTFVGSGTGGESLTGTSMAAPMVGGLAALVGAAHPTWTPAQIKANIVNTADQDVFVNGSEATDTGDTYAPVRVGSGRIDAEAALDNEVIAYSGEDPSVASLGFGPVEVAGPMTLTKSIAVLNTGSTAATYNASYEPITEVPGVEYVLSATSVTVPAGGTASLNVTFTVTDATELTKTVDPTIGRVDKLEVFGAGFPRSVLAEASGRVVLAPATGDAPDLRVPVYSAPRPVSTMTQPASIAASSTATPLSLPLTGTPVSNHGSTPGTEDDVDSIAAGFELSAESGLSPACSTTVTFDCYNLIEERYSDLKQVGYTSDFGIAADGQEMAYFAISTHGAASTPANRSEYDLYIDTTGDGEPDFVAYSTRMTSGVDYADVFVTKLVDLGTGELVDIELNNNDWSWETPDTALYDSDVLVMPVLLGALGVDAANPRISFGVSTFSGSSSQSIDTVGFSGDGSSVLLGANLIEPGVQVVDSTGYAPFVSDVPGTLTVNRNAATYSADGGKGILMLHFHNKVGSKAQVVALIGQPQTVTFTSTPPTPLFIGSAYTVTATGGASGNPVTFTSSTPTVCTVSGAAVTLVAAGTCSIVAVQAGSADFTEATATQSFTVSGSSALTIVTAPKISGSALLGKTVTASTGTWSQPSASLTFTYQWTADGVPIAGASAVSYKIGSSLLGKELGVTVTAHIAGVATPAASATVHVKAVATTTITIKDSTITTKQQAKVTVKVEANGSGKETGTVVLHYGSKKKTDVLHSSDKGKLVFTLPKLKKGSYKIWAEYKGNSNVDGDNSVKKTLKVRKA